MSEITLLRNKIEQRKGQKLQTEKSLQGTQLELVSAKTSLHRHEEAREIIRTVGQQTQNQISFRITDVVSLALESVFESPYNFRVDFVNKRNKTECDMYFERDGNRIDPIGGSGVGAIDIASFALRIASWSMSKSNNTIILDEPFRYLSENYQELAGQMLKEISQKLGIQFIIISHNIELTSSADKVFKVSIKKGVSQISEL